jgi:penicillin-binding protein 2
MKDQRFVRENTEAKRRVLVLSFVVSAIFFLILLRLWHLQILNADDYLSLSESNRLRFVPEAASRGAIMDRNGIVLASNRPSFSLAVVPQEVKDRDALLNQLVSLLKLDRNELLDRWEKGKGRARYYPVVLASNLTRDQVEKVEENRLYLTGVEVEMKPVREYSSGILAAHLLGYIGEISEEELNRKGFEEYNLGDYVGKNGIERSWEKELHGSDGGRELEVDARGRILRTISETFPTVGNSIVLTIDAKLQKQSELAFGDQAGAAVAMDTSNGEILAFVSNPGFDPSLFSGKMPADKWTGYLSDKRHPLENKALTGQYPPGSTFKMITAFAGLESGIVNEKSNVNCNGLYEVVYSKFRCWNRTGHGVTNLKKSLRESCDVYYYQLGDQLGVDAIATMARRFKLGEPMGVGLLNEKGGLIPTTAWKLKRYGKRWFHGETIPVSIGQGYVLLTPIQLASMTATIANEGKIYRPFLVKRVVDTDGKTLKEFNPELLGTTGISADHFRLIKKGMFAVVNEPGGTGGMARMHDMRVAGKTGSSQVVKLRDSKLSTPWNFRDHALFVAFAPYEKPEIAVAVVVEHGGHGGSVAAPIAARILKAWQDGKKPRGNDLRVNGKRDEGDIENREDLPISPDKLDMSGRGVDD